MIYVHVPFCRSFCTYCDFYSEIVRGGMAGPDGCKEGLHTFLTENVSNLGPRTRVKPMREATAFKRYTDDLCAEIRARREEIAASAGVRTLYIGGGTPSVLPLECLQRIVETLDAGPYDEFTVEVNPEDIVEKGPEYVAGLLELGVNRISMGVQSLDDRMLRWMNRRHSADGAREAYLIISGTVCPIDRSVDIISGVPGMDCAMLERTVDEILGWRPEHISAYQLSIEEGSALANMIAAGKVAEAPEEECRAQYELLCRKLREAGYHHYEISNWALPGHEAVHNSAYWTRQPYVGLGPGAHSLTYLDTRGCPTAGCQSASAGISEGERPAFADCPPSEVIQRRSWNSQKTSGWTVEGSETLTPEEIREETVMLQARTDRGPIPESDWFVADDIVADLLA